MLKVLGTLGCSVMNAPPSAMLKNGREPGSSDWPTMICAGVAPMFSSVNVPRRSSIFSPREVTRADGCNVKMMFEGALVMFTLFGSESGPLFVASQAGIARTLW